MNTNNVNIKTSIKDIQKKEKNILTTILNNVLNNKGEKGEKELIKKIITSFFDLNIRLEYIKANRQTLLEKNPKISNILKEYYNSIVELEKKLISF
tara:strand:+ start:287 stop:574 length:288 start_codon:yes stop_codon:yes gene_type:complete